MNWSWRNGIEEKCLTVKLWFQLYTHLESSSRIHTCNITVRGSKFVESSIKFSVLWQFLYFCLENCANGKMCFNSETATTGSLYYSSCRVELKKFRWINCFKSAMARLLLLYFGALRSSWATKLHAAPFLTAQLRSAQQEQGEISLQYLLTFSYVSSWEEQKKSKGTTAPGRVNWRYNCNVDYLLSCCCCRPHWRAFSVHRGYEWHLTYF